MLKKWLGKLFTYIYYKYFFEKEVELNNFVIFFLPDDMAGKHRQFFIRRVKEKSTPGWEAKVQITENVYRILYVKNN